MTAPRDRDADGAAPSDGARPRLVAALGRLEASDLDRVEPPADLWDRISSTVAAEREVASVDRGSPVAGGAGGVVEYRIDADDVVVSTGGGWASFAEANEAPELSDGADGRTLWSSIGDPDLRDLWRLVVTRVRDGAEPVVVPFRCDGPEARRWFEMTVTPERDGAVSFRSELTFEMPRPEVPALLRDAPRDETLPALEVCCWCADAHDGSEWRPVEVVLARRRLLEATPPRVVQGICGRCRSRMSELAGAVDAAGS